VKSGLSRRALLSALLGNLGKTGTHWPTLPVGSRYVIATCLAPLAFPLAAQVKQPAKKGKALPAVGQFIRETDPVTENTVVRLTVPSSASFLPYSRNHFVSSRERIMVFASDRGGHFAPYALDLRTGVMKQVADPAKLEPRSITFDRQEKSIRYLDGGSLMEAGLSRGSPRTLAEGVTSFTSAADGSVYLIASGKLTRKEGNDSRALADEASEAWPQPNSAGCVFSRVFAGPSGPDERELYYVSADGSGKPKLLARGPVRDPYWDEDGQSILFLRDVTTENGTAVAEIHGTALNSGVEYLVSPTSQFACFAPNSDASVFVGASRSRAQPTVILMLRSPHREMTLCEHRSKHPGQVAPVFSPDNRRVYFESDREGKPAIYSVNVELLVESSQ
jgi:oligogalacturonide lyase